MYGRRYPTATRAARTPAAPAAPMQPYTLNLKTGDRVTGIAVGHGGYLLSARDLLSQASAMLGSPAFAQASVTVGGRVVLLSEIASLES